MDLVLKSFRYMPIDSRMYILHSEMEMLIIDPIQSEEGIQYIKDTGCQRAIILLTHAHYDHCLGLTEIKATIPSHVIVSKPGIEVLSNPMKNISAICEVLFLTKPKEVQEQVKAQNIQPVKECADESFEGEMVLEWQEHTLLLKQTPGHSADSICILFDNQYLFTGDSLVNGTPTITRLPGGSSKDYREVTLPYLKSLPQDTIVFPGHGDMGILGPMMRENEQLEEQLRLEKERRIEERKRRTKG